MSTATTNISDCCPEVQVCEALLRDFGGRTAFFGPVRTLKVAGDTAAVRKVLSQPGQLQVLVIDGGGSSRCALFDNELATLATRNSWAGIVLNGCVRESCRLQEHRLGIKALGTNPRKIELAGSEATIDGPISFGEVSFRPGAWLYADADGVVVSEQCIRARARAA